MRPFARSLRYREDDYDEHDNNDHHEGNILDIVNVFFFSAGLGSLALSLIFLATPLPGYISDRFGCRITNFVGATLCMTGLVTSSFAQSLTLMFVTHGLLMGLGISFIYSSCFLVIAKYFKEKLSVATGIAALGVGFGVFLTGPLLQVLLDSYGWRGTYRIMVASFIVVCILGLTYNPNVQETTLVTSFNNDQDKEDKMSRISLYCSLWTFPTFVALVTSMLLTGFAIYIPSIFLVSLFLSNNKYVKMGAKDCGLAWKKKIYYFCLIIIVHR